MNAAIHDDIPDLRDAVRLREQATALKATAERLAEKRMDMLRESWALERDAERIEAAAKRVRSPKRRTYVNDNAEALAKIPDLLTDTGPLGMADISEHLGWTPTRTRAALARLEEVGAIVRTGVKRGTKYQVAEDAPEEHSNVREFGNYGVMVRDAGVALGTFDFTDMQTALPSVSEGTLRKWLAHFEAKGTFESERVEHRKVYAYVEPEGENVARKRTATPEAIAAADARIRMPERGNAVAGAGRGVRAGSALVDALLREVRGFPQVEVRKRSHKFAFYVDGREVASCSTTPGASSLKGSRSALRKAGIMVGES